MYTQYLKHQDGSIRFSGPVSKLKTLPPAVYDVSVDNFGNIYLETAETYTDELIALPNSPAEQIEKDVNSFLTAEVRSKFERYKLLYKRGLLMHGIPGTGKTSIVHLLMRKAIEKGMVVLLNPEPYLVCSTIDTIRKIEKADRPLMVVWEEFEQCVENNEGDLLDLLDGVDQVNNIFFIATTNYLNMIPPRIRNRPSRFAEIIEIGTPNDDLRRAYISAKIHDDDDVDLDEWVAKTEGLTIDGIKDVIISVLVLDVPLEEAVAKIHRMDIEDAELNEVKEKKIRLLKSLSTDEDKPMRERPQRPNR